MITQDHDRKDRTTMRASRDFTTGTVTGGYRGSTAVLDRDTQPRALRRDTAPTRVPGRDPHAPLPTRRKPYQNRLGSKQVVSVRGRRVTTTRQTTLLAKLGATSFVLLIAGVALAMWLSGVSTQQTFHMQQLASQDRQLSNQLETLNRDLENVRSSAEITRRAGEMGMVLPAQPGILAVKENGDIVEERPADPAVRPIIDVNGAPVRPGQASSGSEEINELGDNLEAVPQGHQLPATERPASAPPAPAPGVAPYAPNVPAPAEAADENVPEEAAPDMADAAPEDDNQAGEDGQ
ncbi:hypothetical protein [Corynebacterium suedekumii]|uniref:Cell division protein FtsL n=1 Tax=Corynebacterium suedekumii TaxID=3049801 RepID=A0ABY8VKD1_9CORY|nr:hypothetical protein [Corynebacterium suedekumii]WIM70104.1 hypothetical protein QP029_13115 [Corynebacterium suedekumii]